MTGVIARHAEAVSNVASHLVDGFSTDDNDFPSFSPPPLLSLFLLHFFLFLFSFFVLNTILSIPFLFFFLVFFLLHLFLLHQLPMKLFLLSSFYLSLWERLVIITSLHGEDKLATPQVKSSEHEMHNS